MLRRFALTTILLYAIAFSFTAQIYVFVAAMKQENTGIVYGANGALAGIFVYADPSDPSGNGSSYAITDSLGHYSMTTGLTAGMYNVTAFGFGYLPSQVDFVNVTTGQTTPNVDFDLLASGGISGMVTDAVSADPINNTFLYASLSNGTGTFGWYGTTGPDGKYLIATNLVTGTYNVTIPLAPDGYMSQMTTASVVAGIETKNVDLQLARSGIISGRVAAPNGTGLFGISVFASSSGGTYFGSAQTDISGNYRIGTGLGTDDYTVSAFGAGNFTTYDGMVSVTAGLETSDIDMELTPVTTPPTPSGTIAGRITDQSSNPVISASITASGSGDFGFGETDNNGYYNISSGLGTGDDYNVSVTADGYFDAYYPTLVSVTVGQTTANIDIQMTAMPPETFGTITGTVTGDLNPIPEFQYSAIAMLGLTLAAAIVGKMMIKQKGNKNKINTL